MERKLNNNATIDLNRFRDVVFDADIDFAGAISRTPDDSMVKGMFVKEVLHAIESLAPEKLDDLPLARKRYLPFGDYPLKEYTQLLHDAAVLVYPNLPTGQAVRRLAHFAFPRFHSSRLGKIAVGIFGNDLNRIIPASVRGYKLCATRGEATAEKIDDHTWLIHGKGIPGMIDQYMVGLIEGLFLTFNYKPVSLIDNVSDVDIDILIRF
ncbi:MAG: DUF2378 family protein [Polyangiales bacterium]